MSNVTEVTASAAASTQETAAGKASPGYGKTVGQPQLSDKAKKYYDQLKSKYGNMDFVLVSKDMKETAKSQAASYANPSRMVVLVDEEKIERMAEDESYRKKYEGLIAMAGNKMPELKKMFGQSKNVQGYGMQVNDGGMASFFAVVKKSGDLQAERIRKHAETKKAEKKAADKKAEKKAAEERRSQKRAEKADEAQKADKTHRPEKGRRAEKEDGIHDRLGQYKDEDVEILSASSVEELARMVEDYNYASMSDRVMTDAERIVGSQIDYKQ